MKPIRLAAVIALAAALPLAATAATPSSTQGSKTTSHTPAPTLTPPKIDPKAVEALRKMSAYLQTLPAFELQSDASLDLVTAEGQRIQLDGVVNYKARRPDAFVISLDSDIKKRSYYYDGKQFTVYAPELGVYATVAAPNTIRQTLDMIWQKFGIALPLEDLFRWNEPGARFDSVKEAFAVGPATVGGVQTQAYAFREGNIDWQIWIATGDKPLPRKIMIIDRTDPADPAYIARLTWNVSPTLTSDDFAFRPTKEAKAIKFVSLGQ
ncbi:MAG: DUF2092 domain-containing protein [Caulobacteraceae bacterium]|nr:DUF2092 domain-containing protein [Caulobacteraceae bacterium]